jgi:hypothetical protein
MCIEFDQHKLRLALTSNKHERLTDKHWIFSSGRLSLNELLYPTLNRGVGIGLLGTPPQKKKHALENPSSISIDKLHDVFHHFPM